MLSVGEEFPLFDLTGVGVNNDIINVSTGDIVNDKELNPRFQIKFDIEHDEE